jgi:crossover junction endodeoxyribonuclease RusA
VVRSVIVKGKPRATIRFEVRGLPVTEGNMGANVVAGHAHIYHKKNKGLQAWRSDIAAEARRAAPSTMLAGPLAVRLDFRLPQPASIRNWAGRGKNRVPVRNLPHKRPDIDKLVRAALDALTNVIMGDDSQVVRLRASKSYGTPGVSVEVRTIEHGPRRA